MNVYNLRVEILSLYKQISSLVQLPNRMEPWAKANDNEIYELRFCLAEYNKYVLINMKDKRNDS
jgi:hypothetical protein